MPSDTPAHIMKMQVSIVLQKTPLERLQMCADITEFSLNMLKRQILAKHKDISDGRLKFEMIKLLYSDCFSEEEMTRIEGHFVYPTLPDEGVGQTTI
jgi:hypothetical protein